MKKYKVGIISLGCDKNRIDSEIILGKLKKDFEIVNDPNIAHIIIVNTCGFIEDSKQESINTILEMAKYKEKNCKILIATGCLTQRYKDELLKLMPELDLMFGVNDYDKLVKSIHDYLKNNEKKMYCSYSDKIINEGDRIVTTEGATAYIRIAEGCNNFCAYCIIPKIRGKYRSRSIENIVDEAKKLAQNGYKEVILVAQDTTKYGIDIYGKKMLPILIKKISEIKEIQWIRILYSYPEEITDELIQEMKNNDKVCKYLDMPIQHINDDVLRNMRRKSRKEQVINVLRKFRKEIPSICLRTSLIVGFPGETEEQFNELLEFVKEIQFNKLGVFEYSREEDTKAYEMNNQIEEDIKRIRKEKIMIEQQKISKKQNKEKVGKVYEVIVDGFNGEYLVGRNYEMSPEIDGTIFIKYDKIVKNGDIIKVKIIKSLEYDLIGVVYNEYSE